MMAIEGSTKFIHLMTPPPPPAAGFCASAMEGGGSEGKGYLMICINIYRALIAIVLRGYTLCFL